MRNLGAVSLKQALLMHDKFISETEECDRKHLEPAVRNQDKELSFSGRPELPLPKETMLNTYFREHAPAMIDNAKKDLIKRAIGVLSRRNIVTMEALCAATVGELMKVHKVSRKTIGLVFLMREKYMADNKRRII